ncbi:relaxase/mobilization nuclease domain-containing protein [Pseudomonas kitaguniensis]|uniref:relaxase/mobilization nuclease domain-containing protein n=1 Tax=Pseudomonas kitaguniensis TaxID=2607908 RepID=UPI003CFE0BCB
MIYKKAHTFQSCETLIRYIFAANTREIDKRPLIEYLGGCAVSGSPFKGYRGDIRVVDTRELEDEFNIQMQRYHGSGQKLIEHHVLSLPSQDQLTDTEFESLTQEFLEGIGVDNRMMWVAARHNDTDHSHVHIALCRVQLRFDDSGLASHYGLLANKDDFERGMEVVRTLEQKYGLTSILSPGENVNNKNQASIIRAIAKSIMSGQLETVSDFVHAMAKRGVQMKPVLNKTGEIKGISYKLNSEDGRWMSGSKIMSTVLTFGALCGRLNYSPVRDEATLGLGANPTTPAVSEFERDVKTVSVGMMTSVTFLSNQAREFINRNSREGIIFIESAHNYKIGFKFNFNFIPAARPNGKNEMKTWETIVNLATKNMLGLLQKHFQTPIFKIFLLPPNEIKPSGTVSIQNLTIENLEEKLNKTQMYFRDNGLVEALDRIGLLVHPQRSLPTEKAQFQTHSATHEK